MDEFVALCFGEDEDSEKHSIGSVPRSKKLTASEIKEVFNRAVAEYAAEEGRESGAELKITENSGVRTFFRLYCADKYIHPIYTTPLVLRTRLDIQVEITDVMIEHGVYSDGAREEFWTLVHDLRRHKNYKTDPEDAFALMCMYHVVAVGK